MAMELLQDALGIILMVSLALVLMATGWGSGVLYTRVQGRDRTLIEKHLSERSCQP